MTSWAKHPLHAAGPLLCLGGEFFHAALRCMAGCVSQSPNPPPLALAKWLQRSSRRGLRVLRVVTRIVGGIPKRGSPAWNPVGQPDLLLPAALTPSVLVGKGPFGA
jgi:hypothetical protein